MITDGREKIGQEDFIGKRMIGTNDILIGGIVEVNMEAIYFTVSLPEIEDIESLSFPFMTLLAGKPAIKSARRVGRDFKHGTK